MRKMAFWIGALFLLQGCVFAQEQAVHLKVHVVLIDKELNLKPVPKFSFSLQKQPADAAAQPMLLKTGLDGVVEADLPAGRYQLLTPDPVEFQGKKFSWKLELNLSPPAQNLDLSNDNAVIVTIEAPAAESGGELTALFERLKNAVVTVRADAGEGSGFMVDADGLVLTNAHVVEQSPYLAVQFDAQCKVPAQLLAIDPEKDLAVLRVNLSAFPGAVVTPLAHPAGGKPPVVEGQRVFTIGSPFGKEKTLTMGVVSKIEDHEIYSDISVNPGNSGGPLFDYQGLAVGITAARRERLSRIIRIEDANAILAQAKTKMAGQPPPSGALLPVEPADWFPVEPMKAILQGNVPDANDYKFTAGDFRVWILTPPVRFWLEHEDQLKAGKKKAQRTGGHDDAESAELLQEAQHFRPVITIRAVPEFSQMFRVKFKKDFARMRLLCDGRELPPVHPGRFKFLLYNLKHEVVDTTFMGSYTYSYDSIPAGCNAVSLEIYSEKNPQEPVVHPVDPGILAHIRADFEPYRRLHATQ
ncbi:MAG TPA: serine protease [Candidatus Acidoferrales bacterium]|nr:serine protease [Candidatus Acidoferrales bacterium]